MYRLSPAPIFLPQGLRPCCRHAFAASCSVISESFGWCRVVLHLRSVLETRIMFFSHRAAFPIYCFSHLQMSAVNLHHIANPIFSQGVDGWFTSSILYLHSGKAAGETWIQRRWTCVTTLTWSPGKLCRALLVFRAKFWGWATVYICFYLFVTFYLFS